MRGLENRVKKLTITTIDQVIHLLSKKVIHAKNVLVVHVLRIWKKKSQKKKNVGTSGPGAPMFLHFLFFDFFPHKSVKREQLAHFCHA